MTNRSYLSGKTSFKTELNIKITLLVIIPVLLSAFYFSINAYNQAIELAYEDVQRNASSLALDIKTEISGLTYGLSDLSNNRVLGEIPVNILFSQYAFNQLKSLVQNNPAIDAAFISDGSEFIIEGFPLETLKLDIPSLKAKASNTIAHSNSKMGAQLFYLESEQAPFFERKGETYLFIVMPLRRQLPSLVKPTENTAALFLMLNPVQLIQQVRENKQSSLLITINDKPLYKVDWNRPADLLIAKETIYTLDRDELDMTISVGHGTEQYTQDVINFIGITIIFIVILLAIVLSFTRHFTKRLSRPIKALEAQSKRFIDGNYQVSAENISYTELDTLQQTLNAMAETITEQLSSLKQERNKAEASEKMKARFLANMSHEIRTPLNGVVGLLKMIAKGQLSSDQKSWLESANHSANLLLAVVNDILDFSKIEEGKVAIENIPYNLTDILDNLSASANTLVRDKDIVLAIENNLDHMYWQCDPTRLTQILVNLMSNAIKFTNKGKVTICFSQQDINDRHILSFSVADTGIGIPEEKVTHLFRSFEQADTSTTREFGGTGLGLAISKQLAQLMGGDIDVNSQVGMGSTFKLSIPLLKSEEPAIEKKQTNETPDFSALKILVAEDNKINQTILAHALNQTNCQLTMVENGKLAVQHLTNQLPSLILMDVQMPEMDGVEATRAIRALGFRGPIIMQTANVLDEEVQHYLKNGANAHISKPIDADELYQLIIRYKP